jgi:hypothetical protein
MYGLARGYTIEYSKIGEQKQKRDMRFSPFSEAAEAAKRLQAVGFTIHSIDLTDPRYK